MGTIIKAARILEGFDPDGRPIIHENKAVLVDGDMVLAIDQENVLRRAHPKASILGSSKIAIMPGMINAHHHVGLTPLQMGSPDEPLEIWFGTRLGLRNVDLYLDTLYSAFEMIASGVTTVQHLHSRAPGRADEVVSASADVIRAYRDIGMRASYSMALRDQNRLVYEDDRDFVARLPQELREPMAAYFAQFTLSLSEQRQIFKTLWDEYGKDPRIAIQIAPSNLHWLSDDALEMAGELAAETGAPMHMHLLETPYQKAYARKRTGGSAFEYIHRMGLTGQKLTIGHGVWMTEEDIDLCAHTGTRICHNCSSNFRLKSGLAPVNAFLERKIPVAIGIDEAGINDDRDMLQEMRLVLRAHRRPGIDSRHPLPAEVLRMATEYGAQTTPYAGRIGRLSPGYAADLVMLDWEAVTYPYQDDAIPFVDVLVQRARANSVIGVMIAGEMIYENNRFTRIDRDQVLAEIAARFREPLTEVEQARQWLARQILPHIHSFYDNYIDDVDDLFGKF
ncbi:MAG: amidohydrolase family protein [Salinarimonas sp.]